MSFTEQWYWKAFGELSTDRPSSMGGVTAIPFSAIRGYADEYQLTQSERDVFFRVIRALDNRYREHERERMSKNKPL